MLTGFLAGGPGASPARAQLPQTPAQRQNPNLNTDRGIQAQRSTCPWELWYQLAFLDGRVTVKVGPQSLDQEYIGSTGAGLLGGA